MKNKDKSKLERYIEASAEGTNIARDPERAKKLLHHVQRGNELRRVRKLKKDAEDKEKDKSK